MSINQRLKKLEMVTNDSDFCACFPQGCEIWKQTITEDGTAYTEPILAGEPKPNFCDKCGKPRIKEQIIICFGSIEHLLQEPPIEVVEARKLFLEKNKRR